MRSAIVVAIALWSIGQAAAQDACQARDISHEQRIAACTDAIEGTRSRSPRALAIAYCNRGFALTEKRELDRAFADLEEAIGIDPTYACSFSNRGRI
jgi:hypothetical protein